MLQIKITPGEAMHWYLVHTKPKQEKGALQNLEQQGYQCYLPTLPSEKLRQGQLTVTNEPLFPRYLFIRLGQGDLTKNWAPIPSTKGVSHLVSIGVEPARVDTALIKLLRAHKASLQSQPKRLFKPGDRVRLIEGAFSDMEGIYLMADGASRALVLIEMLSKPFTLRVTPNSIRKAS